LVRSSVCGLMIGISLLVILPDSIRGLMDNSGWTVGDVLILFVVSVVCMFVIDHCLLEHEHLPDNNSSGMDSGQVSAVVRAPAVTLKEENEETAAEESAPCEPDDDDLQCAPCEPDDDDLQCAPCEPDDDDLQCAPCEPDDDDLQCAPCEPDDDDLQCAPCEPDDDEVQSSQGSLLVPPSPQPLPPASPPSGPMPPAGFVPPLKPLHNTDAHGCDGCDGCGPTFTDLFSMFSKRQPRLPSMDAGSIDQDSEHAKTLAPAAENASKLLRDEGSSPAAASKAAMMKEAPPLPQGWGWIPIVMKLTAWMMHAMIDGMLLSSSTTVPTLVFTALA
jgi:hypothetical protein